MSLHYEWTLSLRLRPDVPASFLDELRFHLGLPEHSPHNAELEIDRPCLVTAPDAARPGGRRPVVGCSAAVLKPARLVRPFVFDDAMYELVRLLPV